MATPVAAHVEDPDEYAAVDSVWNRRARGRVLVPVAAGRSARPTTTYCARPASCATHATSVSAAATGPSTNHRGATSVGAASAVAARRCAGRASPRESPRYATTRHRLPRVMVVNANAVNNASQNCRLPRFWKEHPALYFIQAEAAF